MSAYTHVLAAIDLNHEGHHVLSRAAEFAKASGARLSALHVVEYFPADAIAGGPIDLSEDRARKARLTLANWLKDAGLPAAESEVLIGKPSVEVPRVAEQRQVDLLVLGHHPHRGLSAWISHTDAAVLNRANCDVLAVSSKKAG